MKRVLSILQAALVVFVAAIAMGQSQTPSLGEYARAVKKTKPAASKDIAKTYDNDNLPLDGTLSVVGKSPEPAPEADSAKAKDKDKDAADASKTDSKADAEKKPENKGQIKPGQTPDERKKAYEVWHKKIDAQKEKVDLLAREVEVMQREERMRQAAFYADAGNRLRNTAVWDSEEAKYQQQMADKQKSLDEAKTKLNNVQDEAHKAGAPNSVSE